MRRLLRYFSRLQWKLTFSYTLVTSAGLLLTLIVVLVVALSLAQSGTFGTFVHSLMAPIARDLAPFLEADPPDYAGIDGWLDSHYTNDGSLTYDSAQQFSATFDNVEFLAVLEPDGDLLSIEPTALKEDTFVSNLETGALDIIDAASNGRRDPDRTIFINDDSGSIYVAYPITDNTEEVILGIVLIKMLVPVGQEQLARNTLLAVIPIMIPVVLIAAVGGTIFGWVASRGFSRRLRRLTDAAGAWGEGDFSAVVRDNSDDEIGVLARRLNSMAAELDSLLQTRQELATLEERNRLARDLHDSVKQQIFATAMQAGAARALVDQDPESAKQHMRETEQLARDAQQELSVLINELRPAALKGKGLAAAITEHAATWSRHNEIESQVRTAGQRPLPLQIEQTLFRVTQEALSNTARHGSAKHVDVHIAWEAEQITLTIADDGVGFDGRQLSNNGIGLKSMRERMESLGGTLAIESAHGKGTTVIAVAPLQKEPEHDE